MLAGLYLDPRWSSTTSKSAESGNYEAFVVLHYTVASLIETICLKKAFWFLLLTMEAL